jgi:hypothetical protein
MRGGGEGCSVSVDALIRVGNVQKEILLVVFLKKKKKYYYYYNNTNKMMINYECHTLLQCFRSANGFTADPDPDPGFDDQKLRKIYNLKI